MRTTSRGTPVHVSEPVWSPEHTNKWGSPVSWQTPEVPAWSRKWSLHFQKSPSLGSKFHGQPTYKPKGVTESQVEGFRYQAPDIKDLLKVDEYLGE